MRQKQVMNVYVIKDEDKKKKTTRENMHSHIFLFLSKKVKSFTCRSLMDQSREEKHISEPESQKTLSPWVYISIGKNIREATK